MSKNLLNKKGKKAAAAVPNGDVQTNDAPVQSEGIVPPRRVIELERMLTWRRRGRRGQAPFRPRSLFIEIDGRSS